MRTTKQLSITLPTDMAAAIKERVASGAYASESEVIRDGLRALFARDEAMETWLRTEVVAAIDNDPSRGVTPDEVRTTLRENATRRERSAQR